MGTGVTCLCGIGRRPQRRLLERDLDWFAPRLASCSPRVGGVRHNERGNKEMMTSALVFRSRGTELLRRVQSSLVVGSRRTWTQRSSRAYSTGGLRDDGATATATTTATAYEDVSWKIRMLY